MDSSRTPHTAEGLGGSQFIIDPEESYTCGFVAYKKGYKYQLSDAMGICTPILGHNIRTRWIRLFPDGLLILAEGYASDGPSGPSIDTKSFMRAAYGHDALYQLIREGRLPEACRDLADHFLHDQCLVDGMFQWRAAYVYEAVHLFGASNCLPGNGREVLIAP